MLFKRDESGPERYPRKAAMFSRAPPIRQVQVEEYQCFLIGSFRFIFNGLL